MNGINYSFDLLKKNELPIVQKMAKDIILNNYSEFLEDDIINNFIGSKQFEEEFVENIQNCILLKIDNKIIGFSINIDNKIHLMMIDIEYQNKKNGSHLLKYTENILFNEYDTIELQSFTKNLIANSFYVKNGWKKTEEININGLLLSKYIKEKQNYRK
jgi:ribosomal protein S18 acetylase RimI-like enzyme